MENPGKADPGAKCTGKTQERDDRIAALRSQSTAFPGKAVIRWNSVPNAHAYEWQICPVGIPGFLDSSPSRHLFQVKTLLTGQAPGSTHRCRVRALGAKGPSPWSPMISVRVG